VRHSSERKEAMIKKKLPPESKTIAVLSAEEGVSAATLCTTSVAAPAVGTGCCRTAIRRRKASRPETSSRRWSRWRRRKRSGTVRADGRPDAERPTPSNRLSEDERARVLAACHRPSSPASRQDRSSRGWPTKASTWAPSRPSTGCFGPTASCSTGARTRRLGRIDHRQVIEQRAPVSSGLRTSPTSPAR